MAPYKQSIVWLWAILLGMGATGCGSNGDTTTGPAVSMDEMAAALSAQRAADEQQEQQQLAAEQQADSADSPLAAPAEPQQQPDQASRQVAGRPGVEQGGYMSAMVGARRHVLNRVDRLAWLQAVQHFQAEHGRLPRDHDEFMSRIVEHHGIDLGYKEENQEFYYDPGEGQWGEVYVVEMVEEPAAQP